MPEAREERRAWAHLHPSVESLERKRVHSGLVRPYITILPLAGEGRARSILDIHARCRALVAAVEAKVRRRPEGPQKPVSLESREGIGAKIARSPVKEEFIHVS